MAYLMNVPEVSAMLLVLLLIALAATIAFIMSVRKHLRQHLGERQNTCNAGEEIVE